MNSFPRTGLPVRLALIFFLACPPAFSQTAWDRLTHDQPWTADLLTSASARTGLPADQQSLARERVAAWVLGTTTDQALDQRDLLFNRTRLTFLHAMSSAVAPLTCNGSDAAWPAWSTRYSLPPAASGYANFPQVRALYAAGQPGDKTGGRLYLAIHLATSRFLPGSHYLLSVSWNDTGRPDLTWRFSRHGDVSLRAPGDSDWRPLPGAQVCSADCLEFVLPIPLDFSSVQSLALWTLHLENAPPLLDLPGLSCSFPLPLDGGTDAATQLLTSAAAHDLPPNSSVPASVLAAVSRFRGSLALARQIGNVWVLRGPGLLTPPWRPSAGGAAPAVVPAAVGKRAFHRELAVRTLLDAYSPLSPDPYDFVALYSPDALYQDPADPDEENRLGVSTIAGGGPDLTCPSARLARWGSWGHLQTVAFMASPRANGLDLLCGMRVLAHEIGHHWLVRVALQPAAAALTGGELLTNPLAPHHWSWFLSSRGSLMVTYVSGQPIMECTDLGTGRYAVVPVTRPDAFSDLDLYLMGFLPAVQVQPFCLLVHPSVPFTHNAPVGEFTATRVDLTVADLLFPAGTAPPDPAHSQKLFHTALALVTDTPPSDEDLLWINQCTRLFPQYWSQVTAGLSRMDLTPQPPPDLPWE